MTVSAGYRRISGPDHDPCLASGGGSRIQFDHHIGKEERLRRLNTLLPRYRRITCAFLLSAGACIDVSGNKQCQIAKCRMAEKQLLRLN